jgi:RNase H-fold protein (predicted Holliday junction resolvase)
MPTHTVLGISAGTRSLGIAVLKNGELIDWRMKEFKGKWSKKKLNVILLMVQKYVGKYAAEGIALKVPHSKRSSRQLNQLIAALQEFAKENRVKIKTFTIEELEKKFCPVGVRANSRLLLEYALNEYPFVWPEYSRQKRAKTQYYLKLFEAILSARLSTEKYSK